MKYLLLLLAPFILSSSSRDKGSHTTQKLIVWNYTTTTVDLTLLICIEGCKYSYGESITVAAGDEFDEEFSKDGLDIYFCSLTCKSPSFEIFLDLRCGSTTWARVQDANGKEITITSKALSENEFEIRMRNE
jgi:hypothetical protein